MNRHRIQLIAGGAALLLALATLLYAVQLRAVVRAQEETAVAHTAAAATAPRLLQYQGRLSDPASGDPLDGVHTMVFRLYSAPSGGTSLWMEAQDVAVNDGLFSAVLGRTAPLSGDLFSGGALWLGIKVGGDPEAEPRQEILPVVYALSLVPGAQIEAPGDGSSALSLSSGGGGQALYAGGRVIIDGDLAVNGTLSGDHSADAAAHHARYTDAEAAKAARSDPNIVSRYAFDDHVSGGMHSGRALAYGAINADGSIASASGNVSSRWDKNWQCYEITIDGHTYEWQEYVTVVTPVTGGIPSAWSRSGKLCIGIYADSSSPAMKVPFQFVTYKP